jgi:hypothetical protein
LVWTTPRPPARCVTHGWMDRWMARTTTEQAANAYSVSSEGIPTLSCATVLTTPRTIRQLSASSPTGRNGTRASLGAYQTPDQVIPFTIPLGLKQPRLLRRNSISSVQRGGFRISSQGLSP